MKINTHGSNYKLYIVNKTKTTINIYKKKLITRCSYLHNLGQSIKLDSSIGSALELILVSNYYKFTY